MFRISIPAFLFSGHLTVMRNTFLLSICIIVTLLVNAPAEAKFGETRKYFKDWLSACRPDGYCSATTYFNPGFQGLEAAHILRVGREAIPTAKWEVSLITVAHIADATRPISLTIDNTRNWTIEPQTGFAAFESINDFFLTQSKQATAIMAAMLNGTNLRASFLDTAADPHDAEFSLRGLSASLLWIDEKQGQLNAPRVAGTPTNKQLSKPLTDQLRAQLNGIGPEIETMHAASLDCEQLEPQRRREMGMIIAPLDARSTLVAIPCIIGAYNVAYRLYVRNQGEIGSTQTLYWPNYSEELGWGGTDLLTNITFDAPQKRLTMYAKGRGIGDCGSAGEWIWQDFAFKLVSFQHKEKCDGEPDGWPTIYPTR